MSSTDEPRYCFAVFQVNHSERTLDSIYLNRSAASRRSDSLDGRFRTYELRGELTGEYCFAVFQYVQGRKFLDSVYADRSAASRRSDALNGKLKAYRVRTQ